jgi:predicted transposase/invertase (TIGR01784 family)
MTEIDHDRLFKELLSTFFIEFLELFFPQIAAAIDRDSVSFLPQEYFADLTVGETKIVDLLAQVKLAGQDVGFLIHLEAQATSRTEFSRRMFFYFSRLHQKYLQRIYPIVVFSFDTPYREAPLQYSIEFDEFKVMEFNFKAIQLNRLNWRDYLNQQNPVAAALMSKMRINKADRPRVKVECLRVLANLRLDPARTKLISGFVDTYLRLNSREEQVFQESVDTLEGTEREGIMQIVTSWMEQGIAEGIAEGRSDEALSLVRRQLTRRLRLSTLPSRIEAQVQALALPQLEALGEALLDFSSVEDLTIWLQQNS